MIFRERKSAQREGDGPRGGGKAGTRGDNQIAVKQKVVLSRPRNHANESSRSSPAAKRATRSRIASSRRAEARTALHTRALQNLRRTRADLQQTEGLT